jgi:hypothetical membrane protein
MNARYYRAGAVSAVAAGAVWVASAVLQVTGGNHTGTKVEGFTGHAIIGLFTVALLLMVPAMFALARHALSDLGARIAAPGLVVLGLTCIVSNVRGEDPSFFVVVAPITNLMWLAGSIVLAVSLYKAGRIPRGLAIALPFMQVFALPLSAVGGSVVTGAYWIAVGYLMQQGALERPARSAALPAAA